MEEGNVRGGEWKKVMSGATLSVLLSKLHGEWFNEDYAPINIFPQRGDGGDTGVIRQQNSPNPWELDRTPRHGGGKLDTFSESSKLDYITNLMTRPRDFGHHIFAYGLGIRPQFFKIV